MRTIFSIRSLLLALGVLAISAASFAQIGVGVSITIAPPDLPVYEQPVCPGDDYIWIPGYWAYADDDYYWVPGTWVMAPEVGFLWTPGYWAFEENRYFFHEGYWGPEVGFYGGISYGFGYFGHGYEGGRWDNGHFFYNRAVTNVNVTEIHNVYNTTVVNRTINRVSFNGGNGGINERPTSQEEAASRQRHLPPVAAQNQHVQAAHASPQLRASANRGKPPIAATPKPGEFSDRAVVPAREAGPIHNPPAGAGNNFVPNPSSGAENNAARPATAVHPRDLPPVERPAAPDTGNVKQDQKYQQQQQKLQAKQDQERQKLQQKQDQDHQRLEQQKANDARKQQLEQQHQQQTQQLAQKHAQQQQQMQQRQQPAPHPSQPQKP
ncbi:MAG TPA: hypothetical protein VG075_03435 [Candidatus Acidoferrum sp.]|jgi:hypothetical protein|nr:hypothetical protein [Candidatus Acidoferrum sp.]